MDYIMALFDKSFCSTTYINHSISERTLAYNSIIHYEDHNALGNENIKEYMPCFSFIYSVYLQVNNVIGTRVVNLKMSPNKA